MNSKWFMLAVGVLLVVFGLTMTAVSGPMPGAKPLHPRSLGFRLILICFGVFMSILGATGLIHK